MSTTHPKTAHYVPAPPTKADLDYADLPIIDFAKIDTYEGRKALSEQARDAMSNQGFFYVVNHGYTVELTERIFDIADVPFSQVSEEEKRVYVAKMKENGSYQGYQKHIDGGVRDQLEHYNINRDITKREHPKPLHPFLPEIAEFARYNHEKVLHPILRLLALGLELPEDTWVKKHRYSAVGETYVRFMKYHELESYPRTEEEEIKSKNVWLKGHTDFGSITILYSQPVAALQILTKEGSWKWVKHIENALIINAGDALEFLSGGFYRATIHRVVQPPPDQQQYTRLGVFYFCMTDDDVPLEPQLESPVLQHVGVTRTFNGAKAPKMMEWRRARTAAYGQSELKPADKGVEEEVLHGVVDKMPGLVAPPAPHYVSAPPTQEKLDYAELPIIDLAKAKTPEERLALSVQVRDAMSNQGFFYVLNHGYTPEQTERVFDIADIPFTQVSDAEKRSFVAKMEEDGSFQGYKLRRYWSFDGGVRDQIEHYNVNKDITKREHPEALRAFLPEISTFARHNHEDVLHTLLRLLALGLELPEDTLVKRHGFDAVGESYDFGIMTILYSQPVAALQILTKEGDWKWVKHIENALVINAGDALEFVSGGYYHATIHRVVQPPPDHQGRTRLGVFYFCMADEDMSLAPLLESPVLQRAGITKAFENEKIPTMSEWRKARTIAFGRSGTKATEKGVKEQEIINGVAAKFFD
ncbi:hypothetical protein NLJ89_g4977 [Agrocybe chaxingu]|uniref:Fe2OG dioxygenase domain-containing protein n=1 Tax=Agrocybe chaxingu TaxID=84603 RepID=A0A9W8MU20_9AGAR|nr:hypothetical protein NLJ89_g4977 [Agrocybe chaxingu]